MSIDLYQEVTNQIVTMLEQGVVPWRSPILGRTTAGHPKNLETTKPYRGINIFLLAVTAHVKGYGSSYWLTFNQAKTRGGTIKKGEKSSIVVFWKQYDLKDKETGEDKTVPVLRYYNVFNAEQCDGIKAPDAPVFEPLDFQPLEAAESIVTGYQDKPGIEHGGSKAFYRPSMDTVQMPEQTRFTSREEYYSTLFHELAHSTGHASRLNRDFSAQAFGSPGYAREELIAEMAAAFLCGHADIRPSVIENQAAYIQGWLKHLQNDKKLVITAAGAAQKASDWILGQRHA